MIDARLRRPLAAGLLMLTAAGACAAPHPAVCRIAVDERGGQAFGSGTLIDTRDQYGLVVTNWHVVRDATGKIEARFPSGFVSEARPLKLDETWDLAALVIWRPPAEPAPLAKRPPQPGEALTICGYGGGDYLQQTGRCTDYYSPEIGQPQELVELNVEARQGDSGGPIFNAQGELAGVLFGAAQGTTLGSFEGRVKTFLATLAPDIGIARPATLVAQARPAAMSQARALSPPTGVEGSPSNGPVDPFLVAERAQQRQALAARPNPTAPGRLGSQRSEAPSEPTLTPPPSLADRSSAPRLAKEKQPASGWFAPSTGPPSGAGEAVAFSSQTSQPPPAITAGVDWYEDGRTVLAVLGAAALAVSAMRVMG